MLIATDRQKASFRIWAAALWLVAMSAGWMASDAIANPSDDLNGDNHFASASGPEGSGNGDPFLSSGSPDLPDAFLLLATALTSLAFIKFLPGLAEGHAAGSHTRLLQHFTDSRAPPLMMAASARR